MPETQTPTIQLSACMIDAIKPDPKSARNHNTANIEAVKSSLLKFGQRKPIVVNRKNNTIEAGNAVWQAARELGWEEISVVFVDDDDLSAAGFALVDNKSTLLGEWDLPKLKDLLQELDAGAFKLDLTGFNSQEISDILSGESTPKEGLTDDDSLPEEVEDICQLGDLWEFGEHRLYCGDARARENFQTLAGTSKIDLIFTDPPYGIAVQHKDGTIGSGSKKYPARKYKQVIGDEKEYNPAFCLEYCEKVFFWGGNYFAHLLPRGGRWFVWDKKHPEQSALNFSDCELGWSNIPGKVVKKYSCLQCGWATEGEAHHRIHPNQKPIKLFVDILTDISLPGQVIADLYGGSGSTVIACEKINRKCRLMEIDPYYCSLIIKRWEEFTGKKATKIGDSGKKTETTGN